MIGFLLFFFAQKSSIAKFGLTLAFLAIGQNFIALIGQLLDEKSSHLVTLLETYLLIFNKPTRPLLRFFVLLNNTILTISTMRKCLSSIQRWDSNSQPFDNKSPPLTTRPGLPPLLVLSHGLLTK